MPEAPVTEKAGMLVLTRKPGEYIRITVPPSHEPTEIAVCLVAARAGNSRIGFIAPRSSVIGREELYDNAPVQAAEASTDVTAV